VPNNYDPVRSRLYCVRRHRELNLVKRMWASLSPEERKWVRTDKHSLTEIDPEVRLAV
jgi:hypothetical protein